MARGVNRMTRGGDIKLCLWCGEQFSRPLKLSQKQWEGRMYCSKSCSGRTVDVDEESVCKCYVDRKLSSTQVGEIFGIDPMQVRRILKRRGIGLRPSSEGMRLRFADKNLRERLVEAAKGRKHEEAAKEKLRKRVGPVNHNWGGGMTISAGGYLSFTQSAANGVHAGKYLHVVIAEATQRKVMPGEHVHHRDGNKLNNHPDNLQILSAKDHAIVHTRDRENGKRFKQV